MDFTLTILLILGLVLGHIILFLILKNRLREVFGLLANEALLRNNRNFVELAKTTLEKFQSEAKGELTLRQQAIQDLVDPLKQTLEKYEKQVVELERKREQAYGGLRQYLEDVVETQGHLRRETGNLVKALRASHVRGKWGEMSLRRVVELAGLVEHCDFKTQESIAGSGEESYLRPDLIVYLPKERKIVIDAKAPLDSYLQAIETEDEEKKNRLMADHCRQLERHISLLGSKAYWDQLEGSPEFVVLYIPLESLFSAALHQNPQLLEEGTQKRVILATPSTLIALLKAIGYGWRQEKLAENAEQISTMGKELYERLFKLAEHFSRLGTSLERAVQAYNETAGSFERRVFVQARRFKELGVAAKDDIPEITLVDRTPRHLQQNELAESLENEEVSVVEGVRP
ncbi:DNA recombination protein RmuC [Acidobacteria bacterium AH-259-A15]|nr:DNA recombination protein RmuC [Acidobacteria bacterium AH-259-A15]